ncbi:MAG: phosphatidylglycerophosphatase A [bacterium]|nr:phosphatidylglycerophosphatase A [bacterium]MDE0287161.1 phosphatidylglycerophosphatase A [bacterium]MDE0437504.1 phosphatidylglycerophosphatase A [bacterium]
MDRVLASWFGCGLILRRFRGVDAGSGTVAGLVTLVPALLLGRAGWTAQLLAALVVTALSIWASGRFSGEGDPAWVVIDEAAGTFVATIGVGVGPALIGFVVFRIADITKRFPFVSKAEALPGGLGITADDVVAGLWGLGAAWIAQSVLGLG